MSQSESFPIRNEQVVVRRSGGTVFLLDAGSGEYFALDEMGERVWELCDGTHTEAQIAAALAEEYDAPAEHILADVSGVLDALGDGNLLFR